MKMSIRMGFREGFLDPGLSRDDSETQMPGAEITH